jgi:hypothetical protein
MAVYGPITQAMTTQLVTQKLGALRAALNGVVELYQWTSGLATADLVGIGFASADAGDILSAVADSNALAQIDTTGLPPGTYPQPASAYVYAATRARIIGPQ